MAVDCQNTVLVTKAFEVAAINTAERKLFFEGRAAIVTLKSLQLTPCAFKGEGERDTMTKAHLPLSLGMWSCVVIHCHALSAIVMLLQPLSPLLLALA